MAPNLASHAPGSLLTFDLLAVPLRVPSPRTVVASRGLPLGLGGVPVSVGAVSPPALLSRAPGSPSEATSGLILGALAPVSSAALPAAAGAAVASCCRPIRPLRPRRFRGRRGEPSRAHWGLAPTPESPASQPGGSRCPPSLGGSHGPGFRAPRSWGAGPAGPGAVSPAVQGQGHRAGARGSLSESLGLAPRSWGLEPHSRASSPRALGLSRPSLWQPLRVPGESQAPIL